VAVKELLKLFNIGQLVTAKIKNGALFMVYSVNTKLDYGLYSSQASATCCLNTQTGVLLPAFKRKHKNLYCIIHFRVLVPAIVL